MDKFIPGDRVILTSNHYRPKTHSRREPLGMGEMEVVQTKFSSWKHEGEVLCKENGKIMGRWIPFHVLKRVGREGTPPETDSMAEARRTSRLVGIGTTTVHGAPYDPRAEFLTAQELNGGKGTRNTWHQNADRVPCSEAVIAAEKNAAWFEELITRGSPAERQELRDNLIAVRKEWNSGQWKPITDDARETP
jgi:hypothetical protein